MKIAVILGSTRKVRRGERVAKWLMSELAKYSESEFELLDLRDYPLPFFDEPNSPEHMEQGYSSDVATQWAAKIGEADGFILIVSEYNHGPTAVLKNALDFVYKEWNKKPVAFVSYSTSLIGGARAVEQLRAITAELQMASMEAAVHLPTILDTIGTEGKLLQGQYATKLEKVVKQLLWWAHALKAAREESSDRSVTHK